MREKGSFLSALLVALGLTGMVLAQRVKEDSRTMERNEHRCVSTTLRHQA
jgi:hypothetical protein